MKKIIQTAFCMVLTVSVLTAEPVSKSKAIFKSAILPGWGERSIGARGAGRLFFAAEATLWISYAGLSVYKDIQNDDMISFAKAHSGASSFYGSSQYWVDMGSFLSWNDHKEEMLQYRTPDKIYPEKNAWNWDTVENANTFRNIRIAKDKSEQRMTFILGGLVMNRMISMLNIMYQTRNPVESDLIITPLSSQIRLSIPIN